MAMGLRSSFAGYGCGSCYYAYLFQEKEVVVKLNLNYKQ